MIDSETTPTHAGGKAAVWSQRIRQWEASGLTQVEFCRRHQLKIATFRYWRQRLPAKRHATAKGSLRLVPITNPAAEEELPASPSQPASSQGLSIECNGISVRIDDQFNPETLARVIAVLRAV
ncbi:IS66 family insertion sequence element accessory protein TnpA [Acanthopleuribacter pedis]|uniref:Transposase n=1 Tax=Acanthopleuribacter pedis TaxID=442870 RepID=A0A8J7U767_9BACT|nr:hypothetical protein [Acanthopleuribacter pedis]MBO1323507.1 hypothetical protein [Acanthopleuribacter pedis]